MLNVRPMSHEISEIKRAFNVIDALEHMGHTGYKIGGGQYNPFNVMDSKPSFSIYDGGNKFRDHGDEQFRGDCIDALCFGLNLEPGEAIKRAAKLAGVDDSAHIPARMVPARKPTGYHEIPEDWMVELLADRLITNDAEEFFEKRGCPVPMNCTTVPEGAGPRWFQAMAGALVWLYDTAAKVRLNWETSRGDRWLYGGKHAGLWGGDDPPDNCHTLVLMEGETDTARMLGEVPPREGWTYRGQPGATRNVSDIDMYKWTHGRSVYVVTDDDEDGNKAAARWMSGAAENGAIMTRRIVARQLGGVYGDICKQPHGSIEENFDKVFTP